MNFDIQRILGAVTREVAALERDGQPARTARLSRDFDTNVEDLWDALTNQDRIPRWFSPVTGDLRLGGQYQVEGNAGGTITACEPPNRFAATWEFGGGVSWIEVFVSPADGARATLVLEHTAIVDPNFPYGPGAVGVGWDLTLIGLEPHLAGGERLDPAAFEEWSVGEEGRQLITLASDDWGRGSIAAGTPREQALAEAARTTAFYTGAEGPMEEQSGDPPSA